jgi:hypothetical protein
VLGDGERRLPDAEARSRRLVHLAEDEHRRREHARVGHLVPEVEAFARTLPDAREDAYAVVLGERIVDELHDEHRLADARAAEHPGLAADAHGREQVDDLDARLEDLLRGPLGVVVGRRAVDRAGGGAFGQGVHVQGLAHHVQHVAEDRLADGRHDG